MVPFKDLDTLKRIETIEDGVRLTEHFNYLLPHQTKEEKVSFLLYLGDFLRHLDTVFQLQRNS
jgi:hypothetical protein